MRDPVENLDPPGVGNPSLQKDDSNLKSNSSKNVERSKKNSKKTIDLSSDNKFQRFFTVDFVP